MGLTRLEQTSGTARLAWSSQPQTVPMTAMEHTYLGQALRAVVPCIGTPTLQKVVDALFNPSSPQTDRCPVIDRVAGGGRGTGQAGWLPRVSSVLRREEEGARYRRPASGALGRYPRAEHEERMRVQLTQVLVQRTTPDSRTCLL